MTRKIVCMAVLLVAATVAACGGSTQSVAGTAPSQVTPLAVGSEGAGAFSPLKEGKGKGGHSDVGTPPTTGTTPEADDADEDSDGDENGKEHGHGNAMIQIEGFTASIDGSCPGLTIVMENTMSVRTVATPELTTEFQRATCKAIEDAAAPVHLHIAARKHDDMLVAVYVRVQGPKSGHGDDADEETTRTTTATK